MRSSFRQQVAGQPLAQVDNPDPFAVPAWRSPVYQTPHFIIWPVQLVRLIWRILWFVVRHPLLDAAATVLVFTWLKLGWPGLVALAATIVVALCLVYLLWPDWFMRHIVQALRDYWRHWFYRRRWQAAMTVAGLAPSYRGRVLVPVLANVHAARGRRPADGPARNRAGAGSLRRPVTEPGPCLRRTALPGPRLTTWHGHAGVRPR